MPHPSFRTNFLTPEQAGTLRREHGSPLFVYSRQKLIEQATTALGLPAPYGLTVRFAMKANPHPGILKVFKEQGICIDASSGYEAQLALDNGFKPEQVLLTSQQPAHNLEELIGAGVQFNATSLHQLESYGRLFPGTEVSVRLNPGIGSGQTAKTNVGGITSSFGIWHEYIPNVHELIRRYDLQITRLHTHIGSGTNPAVWQEASRLSLELIEQFPEANIINLGGGFKVARLDEESATDLTAVGEAISEELARFQAETGRELKLELEPGNFLVANAGILLSQVEDIVDTGPDGYQFLKLNTGMNDILRPTLYGAQHPVSIINNSSETEEYVIVGHNCESGDLLSPAPGESEVLATRSLPQAHIGDIVLIGGTGAYCASMAAHGYNSFPSAQEVIV